MSTASGADRVRALLTTLLFSLLSSAPALAHSAYQSSVLLDLHGDSAEMELQLPPSRLAQAFGHPLDQGSLGGLRPQLTPYLLARLHVRSPDGRPWAVTPVSPPEWEEVDGQPYVVLHLRLTPASGEPVRSFLLRDDVITDSLHSHNVLVSVRSDWRGNTFANDPELLGVLNGAEPELRVNRAAGSVFAGFGSVFHLGVRHIAEGTDHLLFLLALLLPAPLICRNRRWVGFGGARHGLLTILRVVTAFTVGHSLTLALAAFGLVHVPERPIEVLIAVSILVSALHAIRPIFPGREALIAGSFGLIHGLAFASTLGELGLHGWERALSLLAFNLGIETMQLVVVAAVMPALMLLSRNRAVYSPGRVAGAALAAMAAAGWVVERMTGLDLHVDYVVDMLAKRPVAILFALYAIAIAASVHSRPGRHVSPGR